VDGTGIYLLVISYYSCITYGHTTLVKCIKLNKESSFATFCTVHIMEKMSLKVSLKKSMSTVKEHH